MKIIILKEKHGDQYIEWSDDKNIQEIIAKKIISIRIKEKYCSHLLWFLLHSSNTLFYFGFYTYLYTK